MGPLPWHSPLCNKVARHQVAHLGSPLRKIPRSCRLQFKWHSLHHVAPPLSEGSVAHTVFPIHKIRRTVCQAAILLTAQEIVQHTGCLDDSLRIFGGQVDAAQQDPKPSRKNSECVFYNPPAKQKNCTLCDILRKQCWSSV